MLTVGKTRDRLTVVADQHGCPTTAADLADAILAIIARLDATGWQPAYRGIFHAAGGWRHNVVRACCRDIRGSPPSWRQRAGGRADPDRGLADAGKTSGELPPRLHAAA